MTLIPIPADCYRWFIPLVVLFFMVLFMAQAFNISAQETPPEVELATLPDCGFGASEDANMVVGAVVINFDTGTGCTENLDHTFQIASVPKLFIAGAYYEWMLEGRISASSQMTFNEDYWMGGSTACLQQEDLGRSFTTRELVELMIYCSDNAATWMMVDALGPSRVQEYIDSLGIEGIGPVLPYADVDRIKLSYLDPRWATVPRGISSRYWRRRWTDGLVPDYFSEVPSYNREQLIAANAQYIATATTNTATPRAIAEYIIKLRDDRASMSGTESLVASLMFNTMLKNQREHSSQAFPGTLLIGAKNGFDTGLTAEVNVVFDEVGGFLPNAMFLIFTQQPDLTAFDVQRPGDYFGVLNTYLRDLSPQLVEMLLGTEEPAIPPVTPTANVSLVRYQSESLINPCWSPYRLSGYAASSVATLQSCLTNIYSYDVVPVDEQLGIAVVLRNLSGAENRIVLAFTGPDGTPYSYQTEADFDTQAGVYWLQPINMAGEWTLDIYYNLERVYTDTFIAG